MKSPNPLIPQGSQQNAERGKSNVKVFVFTILAIHVVLLGGLLNQGCKPPNEGDQANLDDSTIEEFPPLSTSFGTQDRAGNSGMGEFYDAPPPVNGFEEEEPVRLLDNTPRNNPPSVTDNPEPKPALRNTASQTGSTSNNLPESVVTPTRSNATDIKPTPAPAPAREESVEHTVVSGDSFYKIGQTYNVNYKEVMAANPEISPSGLQVGMKIKVPKSSTRTPTTSNSPATTVATSGRTYTVQRGDNLTIIAKKQGTTVSAIKQVNNMSSDLIRVGQELVIPAN